MSVILAFNFVFVDADPRIVKASESSDPQKYKIFIPLLLKPVTEIDISQCRLSHQIGFLTGVPFVWGNALQNPNSTWRSAFETALSNWNSSPTKIYFFFDNIGSTEINTYELKDGLGGYTEQNCDGDISSGAHVFGNAYYDITANMRQAVAGHELGHAHYIGHIEPGQIALMGSNPDPNIYYTAQPIDINLINQIYP